MDVRTAIAPLPAVRPVDPDAALVARALADPRAFLELYDRYFERVLGYVAGCACATQRRART